MKQKIYPAFGYIITKTFLNEGELLNDTWMKDGVINIESVDNNGYVNFDNKSCFWAVLRGKQSYTNLQNNATQVLNTYWSSTVEPLSAGKQQLTILEDSESICISNDAGLYKDKPLPAIEVYLLEAGQEIDFPIGSKLYLLTGKVLIDNISISEMRQISLKSETKTLIAATDCFLLNFKY